MQTKAHSSRLEHEAVNPHYATAQFKMCCIRLVQRGSLILGTTVAPSFVFAPYVSRSATYIAWLADVALRKRYVGVIHSDRFAIQNNKL